MKNKPTLKDQYDELIKELTKIDPTTKYGLKRFIKTAKELKKVDRTIKKIRESLNMKCPHCGKGL